MADKPQRSCDAPPGLRRKKSFQGHQYRRKTKPISEQYKADLSKVLGFTVKTNCAFACNEATGYIAFPAGCVIVVCQVQKKKEFHIFNPGHKNLTCIHISLDGQYIVTGESGHLPCVRVFSVSERCQVASFQSHKYGISCVSFSPNSQYIVSVGYQHDNVINVWNWRKNTLAASNKVSIKIRAVAFAEDSSYFVTAGNRHVKFWYIEQSMVPDTETVPLKGRSGLLEAARNHMFCDVACGVGSESKFTYAVSKTGMLCQFNEKRVLENSVQLEATTAFCMSVVNDVIVCGCADGKVLLYSSADLQLLSSFISSEDDIGPRDVIGVSMDSNHMWVHCLHVDHTIRVWDVIDYNCPDMYTSCSFHSDCVWDAKALPKSDATNSSFYTCSKDNTVRLWEIENGDTQLKSNIIIDSVNSISTPSNQKNVKDEGIRSLCISEDAKLLAVGDRNGVIHIYEINGADHRQIKQVEMHSGDILSLAFNSSDGTLASASRDRCIYILDANHTPTYTINDHSAAVTAVEFVHLNNKLRLISCGVDKSLYFCTVENTDGRVEIIRDQHIVEKHAMHDMTVVNDSVLVACGANLREYDIVSGKSSRFIRGCESVSTIIRVTASHDRTIIAISCADKFIYILNYLTGEFLLELGGHSEICAALAFISSPQMTLVTASADSCIFIWKLTRCAKIDDAVVSFQSQLTPHEENDLELSNTPSRDANTTAFFGDPLLNGSLSITDPAVDTITPCDPEEPVEEINGEQTVCNGDAEHDDNVGLNLDTSLPTWLTGKKDKKVKTKKPLGKWASRFQDEYTDIIFLDTPRTTMEWEDINNEERITGDSTDESEEDTKEDSDMKEDSANDECGSKGKEQPNLNATQYYEMVQGDTAASVSTDYASAVEDSEDDKNSPSKNLETLPKKFKSEVAVMINGDLSNESVKMTPICESPTAIASKLSDQVDEVEDGTNDRNCEPVHEAMDENTENFPIRDITELKSEDLEPKTDTEKNCNVEGIGETNSPEKGLNLVKSVENSSSPDIPPAFADFLENLGKKKPRSQPNSLPVRSSYSYTKPGVRLRSASDTASQILSGSESNSPPRQIHRVEVEHANGDSSSDECQEAADELMAAYEKAELIYHKVSVEKSQNDVSARSLLSNTFTSLKGRIDQLQLKIVKEQTIDRMEIDNLPPVLSLLREYSDKLCCMVTEEIRKKDAMKE